MDSDALMLAGMVSQLESRVQALEAQVEATSAQMAPQYAVVGGGFGFGGDEGCWTIEHETQADGTDKLLIKNCRMMISRKLKEFADFDATGGGLIYVEITHTSMEPEVKRKAVSSSSGSGSGSNLEESDDTKTVIPIVQIDKDGNVEKDYRRMPFVQFYE